MAGGTKPRIAGAPAEAPVGDLTFQTIPGLDAVARSEWNALNRDGQVFLRHEFLRAMESGGGTSPEFGWYPHHLVVRDARGALCAAMPMYAKTNGYGEFVFDWAWEQAYARHQMRYYPKLVIAAPYSPVAGARLLHAHDELQDALLRAAIAFAAGAADKADDKVEFSGVHWLFLNDADKACCERAGLPLRLDCQYHWHNDGYENFEHFLAALTSKKRKMIARERRIVREAGIQCRVLHGGDVDEATWRTIHAFYKSTFDRKWGYATLSLPFFLALGRTLPDNVVVVLATRRGEDLACAVNLRDDTRLYGRYWGCRGYHECLHFETCYYAGIEYCIANKLRVFEPGAQGEHKIWRGFLPMPTWSAHWLKHPGFRRAVRAFCLEEQAAKTAQIAALYRSSPYREDAMPAVQRGVRDACLAAAG